MSPDPNAVFRIGCPECDWQSREYSDATGELACKVDAEQHWEREHGGQIPEEAHFGYNQCPQCHDAHGMDGTVSCSECGFIQEAHRA